MTRGPVAGPPRILLFHKPYGVLSQFTDAAGRPTLTDFVREPGLYAAGRLDFDSEGLLVLTSTAWVKTRLGHVHLGFEPATLEHALHAAGFTDVVLTQTPRDGAAPFRAFLLTATRPARPSKRDGGTRPSTGAAS